MPILNYATEIPVEQSVSQIQSLLAKHGAQSISVEYAQGVPVGVVFGLPIFEAELTQFRLPSNPVGVLAAMKADEGIPVRYIRPDQAQRIDWRISKNWLEAQLAIVEAGKAAVDEVFLPYALLADGTTVYERFRANRGQFLLVSAAQK